MRAAFTATNLIWWLHELSPVFADPNGVIKHENPAFGHMVRAQDGDDGNEDDRNPRDPALAIRQVVSRLLSDIYKVNVTATVSGDPGQPLTAKICFPVVCHESQPANGSTDVQAEVDTWALLAYKVMSFFETFSERSYFILLFGLC